MMSTWQIYEPNGLTSSHEHECNDYERGITNRRSLLESLPHRGMHGLLSSPHIVRELFILLAHFKGGWLSDISMSMYN